MGEDNSPKEYTSIGVTNSCKKRLEAEKPEGLRWSSYLEGLAAWGAKR